MARGSCYYMTGFILSFVTMMFMIVAFVTPHWLVSWEQKHSSFHRIGLWEVCFTGFADPMIYQFKYFSGCWWIFHHEVDLIRDMLNPAWFKAVQAFAVFALFSCMLSFIILLAGHCTKNQDDFSNSCVKVGGIMLNMITAFCAGVCVIVFGACAKDRALYRLPMTQYNYFGAGFAFIVMTTLAACFSTAFLISDMKTNKSRNGRNYQD